MAKKKEELPLNQMNVEDLSKRLDKTQEDLFKLKFRAATAPLKNTMQIRVLKKDVARIKTYMNQRRKAS